MAIINFQRAGHLGVAAVTFAAAAAGGDKFVPNRAGTVLIRNSDATATTITVVVPGDAYGIARPDYTLSVAAGATAAFGGLPNDLAGADGYVDLSYSKVTSLTVAAVEV